MLRATLRHRSFPPVGGRLVVGAFCAIATGVRFFLGGANHPLDAISGYPFDVFGGAWAEGFDERSLGALDRGDTRVGHDVWLGNGAIVLPGRTIGNGAVIGAGAVIAHDVPSYAIAVGNPARVVRRRFDDDTVARLNAIAWWDWPIETITRSVGLIRGHDVDALERVR